MPARMRMLVAVAAAAALLPPVAPAAAVLPDGAPAFAAGTGRLVSVEFEFQARLREPGGTPTGRYTLEVPGQLFVTGPVTCFRADGNRAVIGGPVEEGFGPDDDIYPTDEEHALFFVEDNGPPRRGESPDRMSPIFGRPDVLPVDPCAVPIPVDAFRTLAEGNIIVRAEDGLLGSLPGMM